ncbi:hypothetical protein KDL01_01240 [Actinospica durhamensis]|uniref:Uncharacterized protein n=1 Tax=Actinospica durhamensis TaxID=1508375 RepID=A0A941EJA6_9ACTN|nr:hypothetical protein [Actinospica durhamensis]MBR7831863.1 hypothetical protein [Actinospica durhamensis]
MSQLVEMVSTDLAVGAAGEAVRSERVEAPAAAQGDLLRGTAYAVRQRLFQLLTYSRPHAGDSAVDASAPAETQPVE